MFRKLGVPIIGVIENMSYLEAPNGDRLDIFGSGGGEKFAKETGVPFLGAIPMQANIREGGDQGLPIVLDASESKAKLMFNDIACAIAGKVSMMNLQGKS
jgi:ATP-binding protein involved in chromosome partitioning